MTKNKKINLTMMIVFIFMNFVLSMSSTLFNGILDKMVIDLNVSLSKVGYLTSFYAFGAGIGVPIFLIIFNIRIMIERIDELNCHYTPDNWFTEDNSHILKTWD